MTTATTLREELSDGHLSTGMMITIGHPAVVEIVARVGYDFVCLDTEHTALSPETIENLIRGVEATDGETRTIVRVEDSDPIQIRQALDFGADGVMIPLVESAAEAERIVDSTEFPPDGRRGVSGCRAADYGMEMDAHLSRPDPVRLVQIESRRGLDNAEEIAAVDGIDGLFIGPADLSQALDRFGEFDSEVFRDAVDRIRAAGGTTDTPVGIYASDPGSLETHHARGLRYVLAAKDASHLAGGAREFLDAAREVPPAD